MSINQDLQANHHIIALYERSKDQLDRILDSQPNFFALIDKEGRILRANNEFLKFSSEKRKDLVGTELYSYFSSENWQVFRGKLQKIEREGGVSFELPIIDMSDQGGDRPVFWHISSLKIETRPEWRVYEVTGQDITLLRRAEQSLAQLFASVPLGILTVDLNGKIFPSYSMHAERLLDATELSGCNVQDVIFRSGHFDLQDEAKDALELLFAGGIQTTAEFEILRPKLPTEVSIYLDDAENTCRYLGISYHGIEKDGKLQKLLLIVSDYTEIVESRKLKEEAKILEEENIARVLEIRKCSPGILNVAIPEFEKLFQDYARDLVQKKVVELRRDLHAIKGNARVVGFNYMADSAHQFETFLEGISIIEGDALKKDFDIWGKRLTAEWEDTKSLIQILLKDTKFTADSSESTGLSHLINRYQELIANGVPEEDVRRQRLQMMIQHLNSSPVSILEEKIRSQLESLKSATGKSVALELSWGQVKAREEVRLALSEALTHILNNSFAHGIETEDERRAAGKTPQGQIKVQTELNGGKIICCVTDDGRGFDISKIKRKAVAKKLLSFEQSLSVTDSEVIQFIFHDGLSTSDKVDQISGRGVGLDAVRSKARSLGGEISASNRSPAGAEFVWTVPAEANQEIKGLYHTGELVQELISQSQVALDEFGIHLTIENLLPLEKQDSLIYCGRNQLFVCISSIVCQLGSDRELNVKVRVSESGQLEVLIKKGPVIAKVPLSPEFLIEPDVYFKKFNESLGKTVEQEDEISLTFGRIIPSTEIPCLRWQLNEESSQEKKTKLNHRLSKIARELGVRTYGWGDEISIEGLVDIRVLFDNKKSVENDELVLLIDDQKEDRQLKKELIRLIELLIGIQSSVVGG